MDLIPSRTEAWLAFLDSKTLDTNLGMFIPKWGLEFATGDKFAKTNKVKTINNDKINKTNTTDRVKTTYQVAISRGILVNRSFPEYNWQKLTYAKPFKIFTKAVIFYLI